MSKKGRIIIALLILIILVVGFIIVKKHNSKFNYQLTTTKGMFSDLENIIEIDLSNFDFSKVTSMNKMFLIVKI